MTTCLPQKIATPLSSHHSFHAEMKSPIVYVRSTFNDLEYTIADDEHQATHDRAWRHQPLFTSKGRELGSYSLATSTTMVCDVSNLLRILLIDTWILDAMFPEPSD